MLKKEQYRTLKDEGKRSQELNDSYDNIKNNTEHLFTSIWRKKNQKGINSLMGLKREC